MERFFTSCVVNELLLTLPEDAVFSRLGRNRYISNISAAETGRIKLLMLQAFEHIAPRGCWRLQKIAARSADSVTLQNGMTFASRAFADFVGNAPYLWIGAVTIGSGIADLIAADPAAMSKNVVYDAVGSECADSAMDNLQKIAAQELLRHNLAMSKHRFSPGYGKLDLSVQRDIFALLPLESELKIALQDSCIMLPEKSVTAFAAVNDIEI